MRRLRVPECVGRLFCAEVPAREPAPLFWDPVLGGTGVLLRCFVTGAGAESPSLDPVGCSSVNDMKLQLGKK